MQPKTLLYEYLHDLIGDEEQSNSGQIKVAENRPVQVASIPASPESAPAGSQQLIATWSQANHSARDPSVSGYGVEQRSVNAAESPNIPDWAGSRFQVLMFSLRGITLGVPLQAIDSIVRWNGRSTPIPGQPGWQVGLFLHEGRKIALVDLSSLIMPERMTQAAGGTGYLLLVGGSRWGLICDYIQRPIELCAGDISWRRNRQIKPWCFGVIVQKLSVLLDVDAVIRKLGTIDA
jgi:chemotaxis signal transduction protein